MCLYFCRLISLLFNLFSCWCKILTNITETWINNERFIKFGEEPQFLEEMLLKRNNACCLSLLVKPEL